MKNKTWGILWGAAYVLCVLLCLQQSPSTWMRVLMAIAGVLFFVPGGVLMYRGIREKNRGLVLLLRILSAASVLVTTVLFVGLFLSVRGSEELGRYLQAGIILFGTPVMCFNAWVVGLFGWCCIFFASFWKNPKKTD